MVKIGSLIAPERISIFDSAEKREVLNSLCELFRTTDAVGDVEELRKAIFDRENIISTSIGLGIAIPHVRLASVRAMTMAVGIVREGVEYKAFDDLPVNIVIMIAAPEGAHREYLSLLAKIALVLKNSAIRKSIVNAGTPDEVYGILKEH